jgi:hypothetical protein
MPRDADPLTLVRLIRRSVEATDPAATDQRLADLAQRFEDDDEPVSTVDQLDEVLADAELDVDSQGDDPSVALAVAVARYLAHHRGVVDEDDGRLVEQAVRWQWHDHPPESVSDLLTDR